MEQTTDLTTAAVGLVTELIKKGLIVDASKVAPFIEGIGLALQQTGVAAGTVATLIQHLIDQDEITSAEAVMEYVGMIGQTILRLRGGTTPLGAPVSAPPAIASVGISVAAAAKRSPPLAVDGTPRTEQTRFMTAQEQGVQPAVPIKDSVQPEFIVCLEDGRRMKMLKRHLASMYNMTAAQYRKRWGLAPDYPMVAPNYSLQKSKYAVYAGLGTKRMREAADAAKAPR